MNFNLKLKKIRTFRKMTQKELSEKIGLTDQHRIVQYEKGVRVPKKDLVDKMAKALDVNPYGNITYDFDSINEKKDYMSMIKEFMQLQYDSNNLSGYLSYKELYDYINDRTER